MSRRIFFRSLGSRVYTLEVEGSDTMSMVKRKLVDEGIDQSGMRIGSLDLEEFRLIFDGRRLEDDLTVDHYGIQRDQSIYFVYQYKKRNHKPARFRFDLSSDNKNAPPALRRLKKEMKKISKREFQVSYGIARVEIVENLFNWKLYILGPPGTPYEGGVFLVHVSFPEEYPFKPPGISCMTKVYHPCIKDEFLFGLEVLDREKWAPSFDTKDIVEGFRELLGNPGTENYWNEDVQKVYSSDKSKFEETARIYTQRYAYVMDEYGSLLLPPSRSKGPFECEDKSRRESSLKESVVVGGKYPISTLKIRIKQKINGGRLLVAARVFL